MTLEHAGDKPLHFEQKKDLKKWAREKGVAVGALREV